MPSTSLPYSVQTRDGVQIVSFLHDDLDPASVETLNRELPKLVGRSGGLKTVIDFERIVYLPSRVLSVLLESQQAATAAGGQLRLCGLRPAVREVMSLMRLDKVLRILPNCDEAIQSFN
jgi:anti-anti-sigma factor